MDTSSIKTGIIYCRVSSVEQVENTSLESQEERCREYAKRENIKVLKVFIEKGESAKTADRTEFTKAVKFCGENKKFVDYFIVYKLDRFARNQTDHVTIQAILKKYGVALRSTTEPINETPVGRLMEGVLSSFAEFDNNVRTERSKGGMLEKLKQGIWVWQAPLGFYRVSKGSNITPDDSYAQFIRIAFDEWDKGTYSYDSLAKYLAKEVLLQELGKHQLLS
jgi:DNA invertase Pin-like site-specific DNA recombinase